MIHRDDYSALQKAIGIHVLNFTCIPNNPKYNNKFIITEETSGKCYFKDLAIYTIELSKFDEKSNESLNLMLPRIKTGLDRWSAFLTKASSLDRNNLPKELEDPCIKKALNILTTASLNKEEREIYEGHLKWLRIEFSTIKKAKADSKAEGKAEGLAEGKVDIARKMLKRGRPPEEIAEDPGLSLQEIKNLQSC